MNKDCCNINVKELENGYSIEITGKDVKTKCKAVFESCCTDEKIKDCIKSCCGCN